MKILFILVALLIVWTIWGYFVSRVEQAEYTVLEKKNGYEIRTYPSHLVAQTTVTGSYQESMNQGFSIVAGYIFGNNTKRESIAMTAPVISERKQSEKVAMTAPVLVKMEGDTNTISFGMPKNKTLENLPTPNDPRVKIVEIPEKKMTVKRFSWLRNEQRVKEMKNELMAGLIRDGIEAIGVPSYAGYSGPGTPPWMNRHEVLIEIK